MAESQKENQQCTATASIGIGWGGGEGGESSSMISDLTMSSWPSSSTSNRKSPPTESLMVASKRQSPAAHHNCETTSQISGEKTREDVNIKYTSKKPPAITVMNDNYPINTATTTSYLRGEAKDDQDLEKALRASQQQFKDEQRRTNEEKAQMERVMRESLTLAVSSSPPHPHRQQQKQQSLVDDDDEVISIDDDDDDNFNQKISAKRKVADAGEDKTMLANHGGQDDEDDIQKAIRLSLEQQNKNPSINDDESMFDPTCRVLSRKEFEDVVYPLVRIQGGFQKIENGKLVKTGNTIGDVKNSQSQSRAQYGRYMIEHFWRVLDVLEGKIDTSVENEESTAGKIIDAKSDSSDDSAGVLKQEEEGEQQKKRPSSQLGSNITALTDIGHGIGIQVIQAGWTLDVPSRGIELMKGRHGIAEVIRDGVIDELRNDPPDSTKVDLRLENLVHCVLPPQGKSERDEELRRFVLFQDKPEAVQRGLVIFANNAEDVFAARSNDSGNGACLDEHLAELFGNMKVGGRCVTLTDIRCHLTSKEDAMWYHYESFDSGVGAVSWSPNKSVAVHVLTKISDEWMCNEECKYPPSNVVNADTGKLTTKCLYCGKPPRRQQQRNRKKRKLFSPEDGD